MVYFRKPVCKNNYENFNKMIKHVFSSYKTESLFICDATGPVTDGLLRPMDPIRLLPPSHVVQFGLG